MSRPVRSTFILGLAALAVVLAAVGGWRFARASAPVSGPILLISIDALRADRLPVYGYTGIETPAIDALAADGVVFERAYSHAPQTLPAHASLLSGRLPFETGVRANVGFSIRPDERMVAEMLRDRGFETAGIVSSYVLRAETGIDQGFAYFDANLPRVRFGGTAGPLLRDGAESERLAERWLESVRGRRSFVFLHLAEPHAPHRPPVDLASGDPYEGEIAYADEIVGRMVRYLKSHQLYDQATIILVSDHGEGLGDHGERGHGLLVYEEAVRVPLIIKAAGNKGAGRRVRDIVQHVDLVPTILDLARAPVPDNLAGQSLTAIVEDGGSLPARFVYSESLYGRYHFGWSDLTTLTDGRLRYIAASREELYDLDVDPEQRNNIVDERPEEAADLREALSRLEATTVVPPPDPVLPQDRERLEALGNVGTHPFDAGSDRERLDPKGGGAVLDAYRRSMDLVVNREWPDAIRGFQAILREHPDLFDVWRQLGASAWLAGRPERSIDAYRRALALNEDDAETRIRLANVLLRQRRVGDARAEAERALAALEGSTPGPTHASAYELLARIALVRRESSNARRHAATAKSIEPGRPVDRYVEGRLLYDAGRYAEALAHFEEAIAESETSHAAPISDLGFHAGDVLVRLRRFEEAERRFLGELDQFPQHARTWTALANLYHASGRADEAAQTVSEFVRVAPTPETFATAARLLSAFGRVDQAAAIRADAGRRFAADPEAEERAQQ